MSQFSIQVDGVVRSRRRSIALVITDEAKLIVKAPLRTSDHEIRRLVQKHESWIVKKRNELQSRPKAPLIMRDKTEIERLIFERMMHFSDMTGLHPASIKISEAKTRWGSCSPKGHVKISGRLGSAPLEIIDYVIVHELVHLEEKNHAKRFWKKVEAILPDYKERRKWLRLNRISLKNFP